MTSNNITEGLINYIKAELLPILPGYAKLIAGAALIHNINRIGDIVKSLSNGKILRKIDVINEDGCVDVDLWCQDLKRSMEDYCGGRIEINLPALSPIIFTCSDLDTLKRYLKGELR